jgi:hypothetical protein
MAATASPRCCAIAQSQFTCLLPSSPCLGTALDCVRWPGCGLRRVVLAGTGRLLLPTHLLGWGAEPVQFAAVGISLLLGAGSQVRSRLIAFAGSLGAHLVQRLLCIGADPSDFSLGGTGSGLGAGGLLLRLLGGGVGGGCWLTDPVTVGLGGLGTLPGLGAGPRYRGIAFLLSGGTLPGCADEGLDSGQVLAHFLGGGIGLGA